METLLCKICDHPTFICKCDSNWKNFDVLIKDVCCGKIENDVVYTPLSISTMTICFKFNQFVNLQLLKDNLPEKLFVSYNPTSRKSKEKKKKGTDSFYNSFDVKLTFVDRTTTPVTFSNVSIFIFPNGKVKAAGVKTINTIKNMIDELIVLINYVEGVVKEPETLAPENVTIQMICSDFKIKPVKEDPDGWCIKQEDLKNILVKKGYSATFSSLSRYPGINLKFPSLIEKDKQISLLIFRSGSIIITGAKHAKDIAESYQFITDLISKNKSLFYFDINEEIKQKKKKRN
jgi:TATA-box binding protein (TBP) (component of TFIID and TFIIIB)